MNKLSLAAASAVMLVIPTAFAGPLGVPAPAVSRASALPRLPVIAPQSSTRPMPAGQGWIKYNTEVYPREAQYWTTGSVYNVSSNSTDLAYDVNDPCGNPSCTPTQSPQKFIAAERAVAQTVPQRGQRVVQGTRAPPLPRLP